MVKGRKMSSAKAYATRLTLHATHSVISVISFVILSGSIRHWWVELVFIYIYYIYIKYCIIKIHKMYVFSLNIYTKNGLYILNKIYFLYTT